MLFGVSLNDLPTFATVRALLLPVAAGGTYIPAHRAEKVDPIAVLR